MGSLNAMYRFAYAQLSSLYLSLYLDVMHVIKSTRLSSSHFTSGSSVVMNCVRQPERPGDKAIHLLHCCEGANTTLSVALQSLAQLCNVAQGLASYCEPALSVLTSKWW